MCKIDPSPMFACGAGDGTRDLLKLITAYFELGTVNPYTTARYQEIELVRTYELENLLTMIVIGRASITIPMTTTKLPNILPR